MIRGRALWTADERFALEEDVRGAVRYRHRPPNVLHLIKRSVERSPDKVAVKDDSGVSLTYRALWRETERCAAWLKSTWGVDPGDRVALLLSSSVDYVSLFLGVLRCGAVAIPLNTKLAPTELRRVLDCSDPRLLVVAPEYLPKVEEAWPDYPRQKLLVWPGSEPWPDSLKLPKVQEALDPGEDDCAALIFTSGTTGKPKGVILTHGNLVHSVLSYTQVLPLSEEDVTVIAVPLFYVTGLIAQLLFFLALGGTSIIMHRFEENVLLRLIESERVTFIHAVATVFIKMLGASERGRVDLSTLRLAACGGGPVMPKTIADLKTWLPQLDFRPVYGLTETSSPASVMPVDVNTCLERVRSAGRPIPVVDCRVVDEAGQDVPLGEIGELWVRGGVVSPAYYRNPEATAAAHRDGWFATGDLARFDADGFLYIQDRKKDMIIRGGEKVFPSEVEAILTEHPAVIEAAVVGVPDSVYGESVWAFIVPASGNTSSGEELEAWAKKRLARYKVPSTYVFLPELPRSANGKTLRRVLREWAEQGIPTQGATASWRFDP
ncbi:MAG: AMP-binding protein [Bacillota bacterium]|nr:AMP-binding protein [Bacillota bacterium]